ncbi:MAG: hypothetical protein M3Y91_06745 [Actinomycetota bacterium]|nr:hypothetical protein [Actinomycetota bacterium]
MTAARSALLAAEVDVAALIGHADRLAADPEGRCFVHLLSETARDARAHLDRLPQVNQAALDDADPDAIYDAEIGECPDCGVSDHDTCAERLHDLTGDHGPCCCSHQDRSILR